MKAILWLAHLKQGVTSALKKRFVLCESVALKYYDALTRVMGSKNLLSTSVNVVGILVRYPIGVPRPTYSVPN